MTKPDPEHPNPALETEPANPATRMVYSVIVGMAALIAVVFGAGVVTGFANAGGGDHLPVLLGIVAVWMAVVFGLTWFAVKIWPKQGKEPLSRSTRRARNLLYIVIGISAVLGFLLGFNDTDVFSNGAIAVYPALIAIAVWLVIMPIVTAMWWRTTDEHDRASYADGANIAAHAYLFIVPSWWIATRAGLLPAQDPMIVAFIIASIWSAVWLKRKYF